MEWRPLDGTLRYSVSSMGEVRRDSPGRGAIPGRILRARPAGAGYLMVTIYSGAGRRGRVEYVHRLVARAFLGPCPPGKEVNHKNGDKTDPRAPNLEYVTSSENRLHALRTGLAAPPPGVRGEAHPQSKLTEAAVRDIRRRASAGESRRAIVSSHGVSKSLVDQVVARTIWRHVP